MIKIPAELNELAQLFKKNGKTLYLVGGYVRDSYLNIKNSFKEDFDICSSAKLEEVEKILRGKNFTIDKLNEKLGVFNIVGVGKYQYATFRKESYETESHNPENVEFIDSLEKDALRRDFKINAIYFDILENSYNDPLGGIDDLKRRVITTTRAPKIVLNDDAERILRLIRFSCTLGLTIPESELFYAKQNSYKLNFIPKPRIRKEFRKLLDADLVYPELAYTKEAHYKAMKLIGEIGAWKYILPIIEEIQNIKIKDHKGENIYDHILNCLKNAKPEIRMAVLLHDVGKFRSMERGRNFFGAKEFNKVLIEKNLGINGLCYPNEYVARVCRIVNGYDFDRFAILPKDIVKFFISNNHNEIEDIIEIKNTVKNENKKKIKKTRSAERLRKIYEEMKNNNVPFEIEEVNITGEDIIQDNPHVNVEKVDEIIENLHKKVIMNPRKNKKEVLLRLAKHLINSKPKIYKEKK